MGSNAKAVKRRAAGPTSVRGVEIRLLGLAAALVLATGCTKYKALTITSNPSGARVSKGGALVGTTPFQMEAGAGDYLFCSPWYWNFTLEAQLPGEAASSKSIEICAVPDGSTIHFDLVAPASPRPPIRLEDLRGMLFYRELTGALINQGVPRSGFSALRCTPLIYNRPGGGYRCTQPRGPAISCQPLNPNRPESGFQCR